MAGRLSSLNLSCMPNADGAAYFWLKNFAKAVAENPEAVGATSEQSRTVSALVEGFQQAYNRASRPATRTSPNVEAKVLARNEAVRAVRELVNTIKANPAITDVQRVRLGIHKRAPPRRAGELPGASDRETGLRTPRAIRGG